MLTPATEALEVAQATHSLLERWSIDVFLAVVAMDVLLHLTEESIGLEWMAKWNGLSVRGLRFPAYNGRLSLRAIVKTLSLIGFGVAISLEFFAIPYGERTDELTARDAASSQRRIVAAFAVAATANKEAADVRLRAGTLESGLEAERQKTARFQTEADMARLALAHELEFQGPRAKILTKIAPELTKTLAQFAGQRVELFVCGQRGVTEQETLDTWGAIANILGSETVAGVTGAKWKEVPTNLNWATDCGAAKGLGQGVLVGVSKEAPERTMEAAIALGRGLAKLISPLALETPYRVDPKFIKLTVERGFRRGDDPGVVAALDPGLITVIIGQHP